MSLLRRADARQGRSMLGIWITAVIFGLALGRSFGPPAQLVTALAEFSPWAALLILGTFLASWRRQPLLLLCFGFLHGFAHAAPAVLPPRIVAEVVSINVSERRSARVLVVAGSRVYEVDAQATLGSRVIRYGKAKTSLFAPQQRTRLIFAAEAPRSPLMSLGENLTRQVVLASKDIPRELAAFARAVLIGDGSALALSVKEDFRAAGLFHLLIVSGQHVTLVAVFVAAILGFPIRAAYGLRLIPPQIWPHIDATLRIASIAAAIVYAGASGFSAATQRAVLLYAMWQASRVFFGTMPPLRRLAWGLAAQAALFPIGLISPGTAMSWAAYLLVTTSGTHARGLCVAQVKLSVLTAAAFGDFAPLSVVLNLLLVPVFTMAMAAAGVLVLIPQAAPAQALIWAFLETIEVSAYVSRYLGRWEHLTPMVRAAFLAASAIIILNTVRRVTITPYEEKHS